VLAATIPYFNAMFTNDMVESKQDEITVQGIEPRYVIFCIEDNYLFGQS